MLTPITAQITYSVVTLDDLPAILDLRLIFAKEFSSAQSPESIHQFRLSNKAYLEKAIPEGSFIAYLGRCGKDVVGIGAMVFREQPPNFLNLSGRVGYLFNMYTSPSFRRLGVCSQILKLLSDDASRMGVTSFELHATELGELVYIKNGFRKHTEPTYRKQL